ncbi:MAG: DUF5017 domain-containing protein, partial [Pedobacter sp.]
MKHTHHIIALAILYGISLVSCKRNEIVTPEFNVSTDKETYKVDEEVTFNFSGDPQNIVFWSGERGKSYANRERTQEKGVPVLRFMTAAGAGTQSNNLSVLVSSNFSGAYDAQSIANATWTEISTTNATLPSVNLASGKTYRSSTIINANSTADKAFDKNVATAWQSIGMANQWISIDFGDRITYNQVVLKEVAIRTTAYRIEYSNDANSWTTAVTGTSVGAANAIAFPAVTSRYMRVFYVSGSSNANLGELEVYNNPAVAGKALLSGNPVNGTAGLNTPAVVDLSNFVNDTNSPIYLAFKYSAPSNTLKPRPWVVNNFSLTNTVADGTVNTVIANLANAGFKTVDILNPAYLWTFAPNALNPVTMTMPAGPVGESANEDWAVSVPIELNNVALVDVGAPIVSLTTLSPAKTYKYRFNTAGT